MPKKPAKRSRQKAAAPSPAPELIPAKDTAQLDRFVDEYLTDYDGTSAAIRCGIPRLNAVAYAKEWLQDPYVVQRMARVVDERTVDQLTTPQRVMAALLREAHTAPKAADRIRALTKAGEILHAAIESAKGKNGLGRGVLLVPAQAALDDWEHAAQAQQQSLMEWARGDRS